MSDNSNVQDIMDKFDKDVDILYVCKSEGLLSINEISIDVNTLHNRKALPEHYEKTIESIWQQRIESNPLMFNGLKFRLNNAEVCKKNGKFQLNFGQTCYKEFIGTNCSKDAIMYQGLGIKEHNNGQAYLSDAVGVGALTVTNDNKIVLIKRSMKCSESQGLYDRPGGHAEPEEILKAQNSVRR